MGSAGDVNGDGLIDLIIGTLSPDTLAGRTYIIFGQKENEDPIQLSDISDGIGGFVIKGAEHRDYSGYSVGSAGDFNGDGLADVLIGAWGADPNGENSGSTYVVLAIRKLTIPSNCLRSLLARTDLSLMGKQKATTVAFQ